MIKIVGDFIHLSPLNHTSLELTFTVASEFNSERCHYHLLSAEFMANYFISFLPLNQQNPEDNKRINEVKGAISYISNELLDNAMKHNQLGERNCQIEAGVHFLNQDKMMAAIFSKNSIDQPSANKFLGFLDKLLASDPIKLYMQQVEASALDKSLKRSGLGFLTMINDYQAKLGWKFEPHPLDPDIINVTSMVQIKI